MPAMLGCSTVCPNCKHQFTCCPQLPPPCCPALNHACRGAATSGGTLSSCSSLTSHQQQISPSMPLTFVMPSAASSSSTSSHQYSNMGGLYETTNHETEFQRLTDIMKSLRLSGWYYEGYTNLNSDQLLKNAKVGTFLVRNSSDPRYLFSLSMQTEHGPKSVRLLYSNGMFRLDSQPHQKQQMPVFPGVVELIEYYVKLKRIDKNHSELWVDPDGKWSESLNLQRPLRKEGRPAQLKHLARLAINQALNSENTKLKLVQLELPTSLKSYLAEYPYSL